MSQFYFDLNGIDQTYLEEVSLTFNIYLPLVILTRIIKYYN